MLAGFFCVLAFALHCKTLYVTTNTFRVKKYSLVLSFQVSKEKGEELAIEYGIKFMETSAKASINVEEAFFTLARDIKAKMEKRLVSKTTSGLIIAIWVKVLSTGGSQISSKRGGS